SPDGALQIATRYGLQVADVSAWLSATRWATKTGIEKDVVDAVVDALKELALVAPEFTSARVIAPLTC
ncbi:MAG TPA: hypothetical protein VJA26_10820, partial [Gammaproteobacteria bacterium]|nr:hypothetical protein [Gammaproteobacteria bacterium]